MLSNRKSLQVAIEELKQSLEVKTQKMKTYTQRVER